MNLALNMHLELLHYSTTDDEAPCDWEHQHNYVFAGFVKNPEDDESEPKFQARIMTQHSTDRVHSEILQSLESEMMRIRRLTEMICY